MSKIMIDIKDVWVYLGKLLVLENINLQIMENDFIGILGPNGSGKTTLLKTILGLIKLSKGKISVLDKTPENGRYYIGYVPQSSSFDRNFPITVWDVVLMGRLAKRGYFKNYTKEDKELASESLYKIDMYNLKDRQIGQLSGGQQQRVFIARALTTQPQILLLDEPIAGIDAHSQKSVFELLDELNKDITIVMVTHNIGVLSAYVKTIACLGNGHLIYHNSKEITEEMLGKAYNCPVDLIAHGVQHRVLKKHKNGN